MDTDLRRYDTDKDESRARVESALESFEANHYENLSQTLNSASHSPDSSARKRESSRINFLLDARLRGHDEYKI